MKRNIVLFATICLLGANVFSQECSTYFPVETGTIIETTNYDKKDNVTGKTVHTYKDRQTSGDTVIYTVQVNSYDKNDELLFSREMKFKCYQDKLYFDLQNYLDPNTMEAYKEMEIEIESDNLVLPAGLQAGQELNDGSMKISITGSGLPSGINMNIDITNRKVETTENMTTPAGDFECAKVTYDMDMKMTFIKTHTQGKEWWAENVGVVRSETYNKKGKLMGYSVISKITKP